MGATYNYKTGKITRDFHFVELGNACRLSSLPARVGSEWCRKYCNHFDGTWTRFIGPASYVLCKHPKAKDSEGCGEAISTFYEELESRAFSAL
jgi:hypothetical protein